MQTTCQVDSHYRIIIFKSSPNEIQDNYWQEITPIKCVYLALLGLWNYRRSRPERGVAEEEKEEEEGGDSEEEMEEYQVPDEDADIDESSDTECSETDSAGREVSA